MNFVLNFQFSHICNLAFEVEGEKDYDMVSYDHGNLCGFIGL